MTQLDYVIKGISSQTESNYTESAIWVWNFLHGQEPRIILGGRRSSIMNQLNHWIIEHTTYSNLTMESFLNSISILTPLEKEQVKLSLI